jgi:hypothetical protein
VARVDDTGAWRLPAVVPGRYTIAAQTRSTFDDLEAVQIAIDVRAGANTVPALGFGPPRVVEIVVRPRVDVRVIALPAGAGDDVPATWDALAARAIAAPWVTTTTVAPVRATDLGTRPGDQIARLGAGDGVVIACAMPGARLWLDSPIARFGVGSAATPPRCQTVAPGEARATIDLMK